MKSYGLLAADPVRWLLTEESEVKAAVRRFIEGVGPDCIDVAGPPTAHAIMRFREAPKTNKVGLPTVRLHLRKIKHEEQGDGISVSCSDADLEKIETWRVQAGMRKALAATAPKTER